MGKNSPTRYRREGRNAFEPYVDPADVNPYRPYKKWGDDMRSAAWLEGWADAERQYFTEEKTKPKPCCFCANYRGANFCGNCGRRLE